MPLWSTWAVRLALIAGLFSTPAVAQPVTGGSSGVKTTVANIWTAIQTFFGVLGTDNVQSGTTYTTVASDCGKTLVFTNAGAVTVTIDASIVPASGTGCQINVLQAGATKVSVNGAAVAAANLISAHGFTGTQGTLGSMITLHLTTVSASKNAYLAGDGS